MTGDEWHALDAAGLLNLQALQGQLIDPIRESQRQVNADTWGEGGIFGTAAVFIVSSGASQIALSNSSEGYTGDGYRLDLVPGVAAWDEIPFENTGATTYYVGARHNQRPTRALAGVGGTYYYEAYAEDIGELDTADSVTDNGDGTMTLDITSVVAPGWTTADTRPVVVWMSAPQTTTAEAVYEGTAYHDGGAILIDVPHTFGQAAGSVLTNENFYLVLVQGPTITTTDIRNDSAYCFLGEVTGGSSTWDSGDQQILTNIGETIAAFAVEHDVATGEHTDVTAETVHVESTTYPLVTSQYGAAASGADYAYELSDHTGARKLGWKLSASGHPQLLFDNSLSPEIVAAENAQVTLALKNGGSGDLKLLVDGLIEYDEASAAGAFALQADSASDETLHVRNNGAGLMLLDVAGDIESSDLELTADLNVNGDALVQGLLELIDVADYIDPKPFSYDLTPNIDYAWEGDTVVRTLAGTPPSLRFNGASGAQSITRPLGTVSGWEGVLSPAARHIIDGFLMTCVKMAAATLTVYLRRYLRDGSGAVTTVNSQVISNTSGFEARGAAGWLHELDPAYVYYLEIEGDPGGTATNIRIASFEVNLQHYGPQ